MDRFFHHVDQITRQRSRSQLEVALVGAVKALTDARRVRLYKLFFPPGDRLAGLAVEAGAGGLRAHDDGFSWPEGTASVERFPHLHALLSGNARYIDAATAEGSVRVFRIAQSHGQEPFGLIEVQATTGLEQVNPELVLGLAKIFRNCLAMLDYSEVDSLTGLLNRKTFDEYLMNILGRLANEGDAASGALHLPKRRQAHPTADSHWLGVMDIDHFKRINDGFGHLIGDEVLILVSNLMRETFRAQDKLFRFGGEEFVVLLKPTEAENALKTFERFRETIASHVFPQVGNVTISIGFSRIDLHDTPSMILDNADEALYWAKEHGRNRVCAYEALAAEGLLQRQSVMHTEAEFF